MMKRIICMVLVCCLIAALAVGCKGKTDKPAEDTQSGTAGEEVAEPVEMESTDIVRLESIDYDDASKGLVLSLTQGTFTPSSTEEEYAYTITYGKTEKLPLAADAMIDFPMAEDLTKTVTITADELTSEFLAFVEQFDDKPLFTMELADDDTVKNLTYFYLP